MTHFGMPIKEWSDLEFFNQVYSLSGYALRDVQYNVTNPFVMDSQKKIANKNRKRKRKGPLFLEEEAKRVKTTLSDNELPISPKLLDDNNSDAREFVKLSPKFQIIFTESTSSLGSFILGVESVLKCEETDEPLIYSNETGKFIVVKGFNSSFLIPVKSKFILGDVSICRHLITRGDRFDLIIVDPPWENKSVIRKTPYDYAKEFEWSEADFNSLLSDNGLLCIWMTNSPFVRKKSLEFIKKWDFTVCSSLFWLKVTKTRGPISEFNPSHKVPFEKALIACKRGALDNWRAKIPEEWILTSVPNISHSRKPPLLGILRDFSPMSNCLELFGRYLLPDTLTIGNQALKFQDLYYFDENPHLGVSAR